MNKNTHFCKEKGKCIFQACFDRVVDIICELLLLSPGLMKDDGQQARLTRASESLKNVLANLAVVFDKPWLSHVICGYIST